MGRFEADDDTQQPAMGGGADGAGGAFTSLSGDGENTVSYGVLPRGGSSASGAVSAAERGGSSASGGGTIGAFFAAQRGGRGKPRSIEEQSAAGAAERAAGSPAPAAKPAAAHRPRRRVAAKVGTWFYLIFSLVLAVAILHYLGFIHIPSIYAGISKSFAQMKAGLPAVHISLPGPLVSIKDKIAGTPVPALKPQGKPVYPTPGPGPNTCVVVGTGNDYLRVRAQPDKAAQIIDGLAPGQRVEVLEWGAEWNKVKVKDAMGYVAGAYCKREE